MAKLREEFLPETARYGKILSNLYFHQNSSVISRSKVLEIAEHRFGMSELRQQHLRVGKSDWLAGPPLSAVGMKNRFSRIICCRTSRR
ncbi:MAG TPA: hypothetical protein VE083_00635 [Terriglobales bacterium]|nr:hypothetical protein [Terriglobales bacterium]